MIPTIYIIAFSMGLTEVIRKQNILDPAWCPYIAFVMSTIFSFVNGYSGNLDMAVFMGDALLQTGISVGIFAGGTALGKAASKSGRIV